MAEEEESQFHFELEQKFQALQRQYEAVSKDHDIAKAKTVLLQAQVDELTAVGAAKEKHLRERDAELEQRDRSFRELEVSHDDLRDRLKRRSDECDRLRDDIKLQSEELLAAQARLRESQNVATDYQGQLLPTQFERDKYQREAALYGQRVALLEEEVQRQTTNVFTERSAASNMRCELETKISVLQAELEVRDNRLKASDDRMAIHNEKIDSLSKRVRELEETNATNEESFSKESDNLKRIIDLHKRHFDEATSVVSDLETRLTVTGETSARQLAQLQEEAQANASRLENTIATDRERYEATIRDLEGQLHELQNPSRVVTIGLDEGTTSSSLSPVADRYAEFAFSGLNVTEIYDRVVTLEKELIQERAKRKEVELYLNRVLRDIEAKAPVIASQKRDYQRLLESHGQLSKRLDDVIGENTRLRQRAGEAETAAEEALADNEAAQQHNQDLSRQLQHLLKQSMGLGGTTTTVALVGLDGSSSGTGTSEVISEYLVTFNDVEELQVKNAQLLKTIRQLQRDLEAHVEAGSKAKSGTADALQAALKELHGMRDARQRTEEMVKGLAQQRDMYKAMVEETDVALSTYRRSSMGSPATGGGSGTPLLTITGNALHGTPTNSNIVANTTAVQELQRKKAALEDELGRLKERMGHMEENDTALNEALHNAKLEVAGLKADVARSSSDARFHRERAERLEQSLQDVQAQGAQSLARRCELERLLIEQQRECRVRDEAVRASQEQLRQLNESLRRAEVACEVAQLAEGRLVAQLTDSREEVKRQSLLVESVRRIESGVAGRQEEEKTALLNERDALARTVDTLRKQVMERALVEDQRVRSLEEGARLAQTKADAQARELSAVREELVREQGAHKAAADKAVLLERQLNIAQERVTALQGSRTIDSIVEQELAARELDLEKARGDAEALEARLAVAEGHAEQFRKISAASESVLRELRERSQLTKEALEQDLSALRAEVESQRVELLERRSVSATSLQEIEAAREALREVEGQLSAEIQAGHDRLEESQREAEQLRGNVEALTQDVVRFQQVAKDAHGHYERELQLHAQAERELRETSAEADRLRTALAAAEHNAAALSSEMIRKESALTECKAGFDDKLKEQAEALAGLQRVNEILHGQVQSLGSQVEKFHDNRVAATPSGEGNNAADDNGSNNSPSGEDQSATIELRQSNAEMREVVRYMKRERDLLEAKLAVAESESARLSGALAACQRSLDEARAEWRRELEKSHQVSGSGDAGSSSGHVGRSEDDFNRLMAEVNQLNLLRESNAHLRAENKDLALRLAQLDTDLAQARSNLAPLEDAQRRLLAEKEAMSALNLQLTEDATYWRERLNQLVGRYNEVDPEEHRQLQAQVVELQAGLAAANSKASDLEAAVGTKDQDMARLQQRFDQEEAASGRLRNMLREQRTRLEEAVRGLQSKTAAETELLAQVAALKEQQKAVVETTEPSKNVQTTLAANQKSVRLQPTKPTQATSVAATVTATDTTTPTTTSLESSNRPPKRGLDITSTTSAVSADSSSEPATKIAAGSSATSSVPIALPATTTTTAGNAVDAAAAADIEKQNEMKKNLRERLLLAKQNKGTPGPAAPAISASSTASAVATESGSNSASTAPAPAVAEATALNTSIEAEASVVGSGAVGGEAAAAAAEEPMNKRSRGSGQTVADESAPTATAVPVLPQEDVGTVEMAVPEESAEQITAATAGDDIADDIVDDDDMEDGDDDSEDDEDDGDDDEDDDDDNTEDDDEEEGEEGDEDDEEDDEEGGGEENAVLEEEGGNGDSGDGGDGGEGNDGGSDSNVSVGEKKFGLTVTSGSGVWQQGSGNSAAAAFRSFSKSTPAAGNTPASVFGGQSALNNPFSALAQQQQQQPLLFGSAAAVASSSSATTGTFVVGGGSIGFGATATCTNAAAIRASSSSSTGPLIFGTPAALSQQQVASSLNPVAPEFAPQQQPSSNMFGTFGRSNSGLSRSSPAEPIATSEETAAEVHTESEPADVTTGAATVTSAFLPLRQPSLSAASAGGVIPRFGSGSSMGALTVPALLNTNNSNSTVGSGAGAAVVLAPGLAGTNNANQQQPLAPSLALPMSAPSPSGGGSFRALDSTGAAAGMSLFRTPSAVTTVGISTVTGGGASSTGTPRVNTPGAATPSGLFAQAVTQQRQQQQTASGPFSAATQPAAVATAVDKDAAHVEATSPINANNSGSNTNTAAVAAKVINLKSGKAFSVEQRALARAERFGGAAGAGVDSSAADTSTGTAPAPTPVATTTAAGEAKGPGANKGRGGRRGLPPPAAGGRAGRGSRGGRGAAAAASGAGASGDGGGASGDT